MGKGRKADTEQVSIHERGAGGLAHLKGKMVMRRSCAALPGITFPHCDIHGFYFKVLCILFMCMQLSCFFRIVREPLT